MLERAGDPGLVLIHHEICEYFKEVQSTCAGEPELGGILMGSYRGPHIEVTGYTTPGRKDIRRKNLFIRTDERHQTTALSAWRESHATRTFIGEWHTHPSGYPTPSIIDRKTWCRLSVQVATPCVFVIISPKGLELFRQLPNPRNSDITRLTPAESGTVGWVYR